MSGSGRPLRFLAGVGLGWFAVRMVMLWPPVQSLSQAVRAANPLAAALPQPDTIDPSAVQVAALPRRAQARPASRRATQVPASQPSAEEIPSAPALPAPVPAAFAWPGRITGSITPPGESRWSGSAWLIARGGRGIGAAPGASQLGGAQAGLRIAYALTPRLALAARATTPLAGKGRELALGVEWRPGAAPVRLIAEQRFALDGGPSGPGAGAVAGLYRSLPHGFRLDAYGQAGAVVRGGIEPYADGAARIDHALTETRGHAIDLGVGIWGAAQREAARLDLGVSAGLRLPRIGHGTRLSLDWRQRVAGGARPGSGAILTLGSDF